MTAQLILDYPILPEKKNGIPLRDRPAYRVAANPEGCTLHELLCVVLGGKDPGEVATRLIDKFGSAQRLSHARADELAQVRGVGSQGALRLKAAFSLARKQLEPVEMQTVSNPRSAFEAARALLCNQETERLVVISLGARNNILEVSVAFHGSVNSASIRMGELFRTPIRLNATGMVILHNHPTGDPTPSPEDISLTRAVIQAGKLMDIELLDHLVVGSGDRFISLKERGLAFT